MSIRTERVGQKARLETLCFESAGKKYKIQDLIPIFLLQGNRYALVLRLV
jgi:hypothetical protein